MKIGILLLLFYLNLSNAVAGDLLKYQEFLDMGIKGARSAYNPYLYLPKKQFEAQRQKNYDLFVQDIQSLQAIFGGDILEHLPQKGFHLIALDDAPEMQKVISQILKDLLKTKVGSQICFYQTFRVPEVIQEKFGLLAADAFEVAQDCGRELEEEMFKTSGIKLSQSTEFGGLTRTPLTNFYFVFLPEGEPAPYDSWTGYEEKDLFQNAYTFIYIDAKTFSKDYLYRVFAHELEMRTDKRHFTTVVLEKFLKIRDKDFLCHAYSLLYQPLVRLGLSTIRAFKAELSMLTELGRQSAVDFHDLMNLSCTDRVKASIKMVSNFQPLLGAEAQAYQYAFSTVCGTSKASSAFDEDALVNLLALRSEPESSKTICEVMSTPIFGSAGGRYAYQPGPRPNIGNSGGLQSNSSIKNSELQVQNRIGNQDYYNRNNANDPLKISEPFKTKQGVQPSIQPLPKDVLDRFIKGY